MLSVAENEMGLGTKLRPIGWSLAGALLLLPFIAMQFTREIVWTARDFLVWGLMLATVGGLFELAVRISPNRAYRTGFGLALMAAFLVVWVNLAVGIVGSDDNPSDAFFFWALGVGIVAALVARLKASGMVYAMLATAAGLAAAFIAAQASARDELWVSPVLEAFGTGVFALMFLGAAALFRKAASDERHSSSSS